MKDDEFDFHFLETAHEHSSWHREELRRSKNCGCFHCKRIFDLKECENLEWVDDGITLWPDDEATLLCPFCGVDAVIGDASGLPITTDFLEQMYKEWFG